MVSKNLKKESVFLCIMALGMILWVTIFILCVIAFINSAPGVIPPIVSSETTIWLFFGGMGMAIIGSAFSLMYGKRNLQELNSQYQKLTG